MTVAERPVEVPELGVRRAADVGAVAGGRAPDGRTGSAMPDAAGDRARRLGR